MATSILTQPPAVRLVDNDLVSVALEIADLEGLGFRAALVLAEAHRAELTTYAHDWDAWHKARREAHEGQAVCPMCGARIEGRQYYVG